MNKPNYTNCEICSGKIRVFRKIASGQQVCIRCQEEHRELAGLTGAFLQWLVAKPCGRTDRIYLVKSPPKQENKNCLKDMRCPEADCKSSGPFRIAVTLDTTINLSDEGYKLEDDYANRRVEWDFDSDCECVKCGFESFVEEFKRTPLDLDSDIHAANKAYYDTPKAAVQRALERNKNNIDVTDEDCNCLGCGPFYLTDGYDILNGDVYCVDCYEELKHLLKLPNYQTVQAILDLRDNKNQ